MAYLLLIVLLGVLALYGRSVLRTTGHSLQELFNFLTLLIGLIFLGSLLYLLFLYS